MRYLIHSTQPFPAHVADATGRALCNCEAAAWKKTKARSGYKAGEWRLIDDEQSDHIEDFSRALKTCERCQRRQKAIKAWAMKKENASTGREQAIRRARGE